MGLGLGLGLGFESVWKAWCIRWKAAVSARVRVKVRVRVRVNLVYPLECGGRASLTIGVVAQRTHPVGLLQLFLGGVAGYAEDHIVVRLLREARGWG